MDDIELEFNIESPTKAFGAHLDLPNNNRILFSGIFGIGKTYFLRRFFEVKADKYVAIRLCPINYSIASNEDIFKFLKYDILYELMVEHNWMPEELNPEFYESDFLASIAIVHSAELTKTFIKHIPIIGKPIVKIIQQLADLEKIIDAARKRAEKNDEFRLLHEYWENTRESYLYEEDSINQLIHGALNQLTTKSQEEESNGREKILIIDDLDRLDPDHIFRLFNIFSAHFDDQKENKWGFDRVILVADIDNIRSIFHARYGQDTDFSGYIDKFFSREVFRFNNEEGIVESLQTHFSLLTQQKENQRLVSKRVFDKYLKPILLPMIYAGAINLRSLVKIEIVDRNTEPTIIFSNRDKTYSLLQFPGLIGLDIIIQLFGSIRSTQNAIDQTLRFLKQSGQEESKDIYRKRIEGLLVFLCFDEEKIYTNDPVDCQLESNYGEELSFQCSISEDPGSEIFSGRIKEESDGHFGPKYKSKLNFFRLLAKTVEKLMDIKAYS